MAKKKSKKGIFSFIRGKGKKPAAEKKAAKKKAGKQPKREEPRIKLSRLRFCPECGSDNIHYVEERDELVCRTCGGIFSHLTPEQEEKFAEVMKV